jgi:Ycf66 protein N-terminus
VNFIPASVLLGIVLLGASVSLFLMGKFKPQLYRDSDNAYALLGIICSVILIAQFGALGFGMSFQQLIMIGALLVLMWENIQMRANNPVKRSSGDDERPARRNYRADLEDPMPVEGRGGRDWQADGLRSEAQRGDRSLSYGDQNRRSARDNSRPSVRPARQSRFDSRLDNDAPVNPGEWGEPRSIPERSSRSRDDDRPSRAPRSDQDFDRPMDRADNFGDDFGGGERNRADRGNDESADRPRRPRRRPVDDIPTVDYRPVDPLDLDTPEPKSSSWGPSN